MSNLKQQIKESPRLVQDELIRLNNRMRELETKEIGLIAGMKEQAEQIAELKKQLNWKTLAVSRETYNAVAKQAIREMLVAMKEVSSGVGYGIVIHISDIEKYADNLEKE